MAMRSDSAKEPLSPSGQMVPTLSSMSGIAPLSEPTTEHPLMSASIMMRGLCSTHSRVVRLGHRNNVARMEETGHAIRVRETVGVHDVIVL